MRNSVSGGVKAVCGMVLVIGFGWVMPASAQPPQATNVYVVGTETVFGAGDDIFIAVEFDQDITVTDAIVDARPHLTLTVAPDSRRATYQEHAGNTLFLRYTVQPGDYSRPLRYSTVQSLNGDGATIAGPGGTWSRFTDGIPAPTSPGALAGPGKPVVEVRTIQISPPATTVPEGSSATLTVSRGGTAPTALTVPLQSSSSFVASVPASVTIPVGEPEVTFSVTGNWDGQTFISARPQNYPAAGYVTNTFTVTSGPVPTFTISGPNTLWEPHPSFTDDLARPSSGDYTVTLSRTHTNDVTVTLTLDPTAAAVFAGPTPGTRTVTIPAGQTVRDNIRINARDGDAVVEVDGTASNGYQLTNPFEISVRNLPPMIQGADEIQDLGERSVGAPVSFSMSATDAPADLLGPPPLTATWNFGEGLPVTVDCDGDGSSVVSHSYSSPGVRTVSVTVRDKDGGSAVATLFRVDILPGTELLALTLGRRTPPVGYNGFTAGLGEGRIDILSPADFGENVTGPHATIYQFTSVQPSTQVRAVPEPVEIVVDSITGDTEWFDSFFHTWIGEGFREPSATAYPLADPDQFVALEGEDRQITAVFSREFLPGDGWGDIDQDGLPDQWEEQYWPGQLRFENPSTYFNDDEDFLPRDTDVEMGYDPANRPGNFTPDGIGFGDIFELRGQPGLEGVLNDPDHVPQYPVDARDFFGTDPTNPDTDGDGMSDGWEYYFWWNAHFNGITGERYDPTQIIASALAITAQEIVDAFHPLIPGDANNDLDEDNLSDLEEYLLGTNPIHWDTDGDMMADGWEVFRGLNPLAQDGGQNPDGDFMAAEGYSIDEERDQSQPLLEAVHYHVYDIWGYDPRTGWAGSHRGRDREGRISPHTTYMNNIDEYAIMRFWINERRVGAIGPDGWAEFSTNPLRADTDGDGAPDGWETYVYFDPTLNQADPEWDIDDDGLILPEEFDGQDTAGGPSGGTVEVVVDPDTGETSFSELVPLGNVNARWWNKFWPTDPNNADTDGDFLGDGAERGEFVIGPKLYNPPAEWDNAYIRGSRAGGGLNPTTVDTDMDFIPDYWEAQYRYGRVLFVNFDGSITEVGGMDGTIFDSKTLIDILGNPAPTELTGQPENYDYDGDGLDNYQEYWANAVWHFNYDKWMPGQGPGAYNPKLLFTGRPFPWDWAIAANRWEQVPPEGLPPPFHVPYAYIEPELRRRGVSYASTDPSLWDSDFNGLDDHYEMFYGLNPLWSEQIDIIGKGAPARVPDIRIQPWTAGESMADPDQDGIPNWEEGIFPDRPEPVNLNTDPSPYWVTDMSYEESWVNLYYGPGTPPWYFPPPIEDNPVYPYPAIQALFLFPPTYVYSFANDEGYDSDNDNIPDKVEVTGSGDRGVTDPSNFESPKLRKALYLDGRSAARTRGSTSHELNQLRSWTVEVWVRSEQPQSPTGQRQIIIERPVQLWETDPMPAPEWVRRTFRIGLEPDGKPFAEYNNSGNDLLTEVVRGTGWILQPDEWYHIAAVMDGLNGHLSIYVNGIMAGRRGTMLIPATGIIDGNPPMVFAAPIVVGAADRNPRGMVQNPIPNMVTPPDLHLHFTGWIDEIRVWDGPRTHNDIVASHRERMDIETVRETMVNYAAAMALLPDVNPPDMPSYQVWETVPPVVLYHYSFDNLPDPTYDPIVPQGFELLNGRPNDATYPGIPWWKQAPDRSRVYSDYLFVHWVQNSPSHVPAIPVLNRFNNVVDYEFGVVHASPFWTANAPEGTFNFRRRVDPSFQRYITGDSSLTQGGFRDARGLLPLWYARADMDVPLWDTGEPGIADHDSNQDGIPDWWYVKHGFNPQGPSIADEDPDGDGLSNYWEYRLGSDPHDAYSLDPTGQIDDGNFDSDRDGLTNVDEILVYGTDPTRWDTDDDGVSDGQEIAQGSDPLNPYDPHQFGAMQVDGNGRLLIRSETERDAHRRWTVEAWVKPDGPSVSGVILRRAEQIAFQGVRRIDYELGMDENVPYIRYVFRQDDTVITNRVDGISPVGSTWVHVAGVLDDASNQLMLYVNAKRVAYRRPVTLAPPTTFGRFESTIGGGPLDATGAVTAGFEGQIDAVRVWDYPRRGIEIQHTRGVLLPEFDGIEPDNVRAPVRIFNFNTRGQYAHNSRYTKDWLTDWRHAADFEGDARIVETPFPPRNLDSDDDGMSDYDERTAGLLEHRSESPLVYRVLDYDGQAGSVVEVDELIDSEQTGQFAHTDWTVEAWVRPTAMPGVRAPLVRRLSDPGGKRTFEIGLLPVNGALHPYARFQRADGDGAFIELSHPINIPVGDTAEDWTHLAATYDDGEFSLFVNGERLQFKRLESVVPTIGNGGRVELGGEQFVGQMHEIRIWREPRRPDQVDNFKDRTLLFAGVDINNSFVGGETYLGRITSRREDGLVYNLEPGFRSHKFALLAWIRMERDAAGGIVAERKTETVSPDGFQEWQISHSLRITDDGNPQVYWEGLVDVLSPAGLIRLVDQRDVTSEADIRDGEWHHLAVVGDGRHITLYIDGRQDRTAVRHFAELPVPFGGPDLLAVAYESYMPIDSELRVADEGIEAIIDEVMFWNEDMDEADVDRYMRYGLDVGDVDFGLQPIVPLPDGAVDPGAERQRLVSYLTFDGEQDIPFVKDRVSRQDYRILPLPSGNELLSGSRPPIITDPVMFWREEMSGFFAAVDGGEHVENYIMRNHYGHAGLMLGNVRFIELNVDEIVHMITDSNADGIPDWWYVRYGFDAGGESIAHEDPDRDGLSNIMEYQSGSDPLNAYSMDPQGRFMDYDTRPTAYAPTFGWTFDDGDRIADAWEVRFMHKAPGTLNRGLDPLYYDAHLDPDEDGWSNYAEFKVDTDPLDPTSFPTPRVRFSLRYHGWHGATIQDLLDADIQVHLHIYDNPAMDGYPVATHIMEEAIIETSELDAGHLVEGRNHIFAFADVDVDGVWSPETEPAGIAEFDLSWGDWAEIEIGLTDDRQMRGFPRVSWEPVDDPVVDGYGIVANQGRDELFTRIIRGRDRSYLHEGDIRLEGMHGVGGDGSQEAVTFMILRNHSVYGLDFDIPLDLAIAIVTNTVTQTPTIVTGHDTVFKHARNELVWSMDRNATWYTIEIQGSNADGQRVESTLLQTARLNAPFRDRDGNYRADLPFYAGDLRPDGGVWANGRYWLRVASGMELGQQRVSDWRPFNLRVREPKQSGGTSMIEGKLYYFGGHDYFSDLPRAAGAVSNNMPVIVQSFSNPGFSGVPDAQFTIAPSDWASTEHRMEATFQLKGLHGGTYYIRAFVDANRNGKLDFWESWGYGRDLLSYYEPVRISMESPAVSRVSDQMIIIRDRDTDGDSLPDIWEYDYYQRSGGIAPAGVAGFLDRIGGGDVGPNSLKMRARWQYGLDAWSNVAFVDQNNNGIDDEWERYYFGRLLAPGEHLLDMDGDGMRVIDEYRAGTDPTNAGDSLRIDSLISGHGTPAMVWSGEMNYRVQMTDAIGPAPASWVRDDELSNYTRTALGGGAYTWQYRDPLPPAGGTRYYRVIVVDDPPDDPLPPLE